MTASQWDEIHIRGDVAHHAFRIYEATEPVREDEPQEAPEVEQLRWARWVAAEAQQLVEASVVEARRMGASWATIGAVHGVTRQAAQQRFGHLESTQWRLADDDAPLS